MFTKKAEQTPSLTTDRRPPIPAGRPTATSTPLTGRPSFVAADLVIQGNLSSAGEIQIDGEVQGEVRAKRILVAKRGFVSGALIAE
jgi:cytoskeletal protein CcmA (bactofilin family)